jgi:hypothetical protein
MSHMQPHENEPANGTVGPDVEGLLEALQQALAKRPPAGQPAIEGQVIAGSIGTAIRQAAPAEARAIRARLIALLRDTPPAWPTATIVSYLAADTHLTEGDIDCLARHAGGHNAALGRLTANPMVRDEKVRELLSSPYSFGPATFTITRTAPFSDALVRQLIGIYRGHKASPMATLLARPEVRSDTIAEYLADSGTKAKDTLLAVARNPSHRAHPQIREHLLRNAGAPGVAELLIGDQVPGEFPVLFPVLVHRRDPDVLNRYVDAMVATGNARLAPKQLAKLFQDPAVARTAFSVLHRILPTEQEPPAPTRTPKRRAP